MGAVKTRITLRNPSAPSVTPITVDAVADASVMHLCLPAGIVRRLQLEQADQREVTIADGSRQLCRYVGPVQINFANRGCFVGAMELGDEVLLGAVPMEDMDLVVCPSRQTVTVNPANPNIACSIAKGFRS